MPDDMPQESARPTCPHCRQPLVRLGWNTSEDGNLVTIFHAEPHCGNVLSVQLLEHPRQQSRIHVPGLLPH